jgi:hypothetical protein
MSWPRLRIGRCAPPSARDADSEAGRAGKSLRAFFRRVDRFIGILLEKKRWDALREILPVYERLANDAGGILAVQAETATSLTEEETAKVRRSLEKSWGGPVSLRTRVREDSVGRGCASRGRPGVGQQFERTAGTSARGVARRDSVVAPLMGRPRRGRKNGPVNRATTLKLKGT